MEVGAYEAKTHLPALLERVSRGEEITITKHGKAIARLVPMPGANLAKRQAAIDSLMTFGKGRTLDVPIKQLIEEGRM
ncbi:MAG TPA: type II toxin-antitoxin system prevent-host-death family antitoxin [Stellaceae bacterium]|jgi:prevent-host-death family protein